MKMYITFGYNHNHLVLGREFNHTTVAVIDCDNYQMGRDLAFAYFGRKWSMPYTEEDFDMDNLEKYNWRLVPLSRKDSYCLDWAE